MMKILHTADWHIGKIVNEFSMLEDQQFIFAQLFTLIEKEQPDVIIVAGDIYDRAIPPKEAVDLLDQVLTTLINKFNIPILIIGGNHDSSERLSFGTKILEKSQLFIEAKYDTHTGIKHLVFEDEYGPVNFYLIPYLNPNYLRLALNLPQIVDHQTAFQAVIKEVSIHPDERNILINHNFFTAVDENSLISDSERSLSIGGTELIDVELIKHFDYVALGHLHRMQKIKYDHIRYSGSLLKYSASEINANKGVIIVNLRNKHDMEIEFKPLKPLRDMIKLTGYFDDLMQGQNGLKCDDYVYVELLDQGELFEPLAQLRTVYPNIMHLERKGMVEKIISENRSADLKKKAPLDIFTDFYFYVTGEEASESQLTEVQQVMNAIFERGMRDED